MQAYLRTHALTLCALLLIGFAAAAEPSLPIPEEQRALESIRGSVPGRIVWESNRDGEWRLYTMNADGTGVRRLTNGPGNDLVARFSPDGARIVFTRMPDERHSDVWIMNADGSDARQIIEHATSAVWRKGGTALQFQRQPNPGVEFWETWEYDMATGEQRKLFPADGVEYGPQIYSGIANDDGSRVVIWSPRPRGTWVMSPDGGVQTLVHPGCMGQVDFDQRYGYGVRTGGVFVRFDLETGEDTLDFNVLTGPWSHTYFPRVSSDGRWLAYAACPPDQHNHETSDYELFIVRMRDWVTQGDPIRLTFNSRTDREPDICLVADRLPDGPYDMGEPPHELIIHAFAGEAADPDFGGRAGTWPTEGDCTADATWLPDDALGGGGGSMRIDFQIDGEPNSVAYWITPARGTLDLSGYSELTLWVKGSARSFTVVVEDDTAEGDGGAEGVADFVVEGVTDEWREFRLPLDGFASRQRGGRIDWSSVRVLAIALISPQNPRSGTLQIDSIVAVR